MSASESGEGRDSSARETVRYIHESLCEAGNTDGPRVLHVIPHLAVGGATTHVLYLGAGTGKMGYPSEVACGFENTSEGHLLDTATRLGVRLIMLPGLHRAPRLRDPSLVRMVGRIVDEGGYDILHSHGWKSHMLAAAVRRSRPNLRLIHQVHGWSWPRDSRSLATQVLIRTTRIAARHTDLFGIVTSKDREKGLSLGIGRPEQYTLIRGGIDPHKFTAGTEEQRRKARARLGLAQDATVIGTVGGLRKQKAPERFVETIAGLNGSIPKLRAVWIGDGPLRESIEEQIARLDLENTITLAGSRQDVDELLAGLDLFLLTSIYEGLPFAVLEALATGIPVVSTPNDGLLELADMPEADEHLRVGPPEKLTSLVEESINDRPPPYKSWKPITLEDTLTQTCEAYDRLLNM